MLDFFKALAVFTGTIIGVGMFSLPYVASQAGFFVVLFYFLFLSGIAILIHLIYGRISLGTEGLHRLPGYTKEYLGPKWEKASFLLIGLGLTGALLAYLIVGGKFLNSLFAPSFGGNEFIYTFLFFSIGAYFIFRGIKAISGIELFLLIAFFAVIFLFFIKAQPFINVNHLLSIDWKLFTLPYGVVLFSLWGSGIVPEIKEMVNGDQKTLEKVIIYGILISAVTYLIFIFAVLGATGLNTSKEAVSGLVSVLGGNVLKVGFLFGIIACLTSFLTLGLTLKKILWYDLGLSSKLSWFLTCFFPLFLFLIGLRGFIDIIAITGALAIGAEGIIIIFMYQAFLKKKFSKKMNPILYLLPLFFILGVAFELFYFFIR